MTTAPRRSRGRCRRADRPAGSAWIAVPELLVAERHAPPRGPVSCRPPCCQQLIALPVRGSSLSHAQIMATLGIPVGSIGPTRSRSLDRLRRDPAIVRLINS